MRLWWGFLKLLVFVGLAACFLSAFLSHGASKAPPSPRVEQARREMQELIDAFERCRVDVGDGAFHQAEVAAARVLIGPGVSPRGVVDLPHGREVADLLCANRFLLAGWKGPYLEEIPEDPWGRAYVITWSGLTSRHENVWILSAGPNGKLDTRAADTFAQEDDVAMVLYW